MIENKSLSRTFARYRFVYHLPTRFEASPWSNPRAPTHQTL